jgi:hypothetical protein
MGSTGPEGGNKSHATAAASSAPLYNSKVLRGFEASGLCVLCSAVAGFDLDVACIAALT